MTNADLVHVCLVSAGATLGTSLLSCAAHFGNREDDYYLPYALTCFGGTIVFLALGALYGATSLAGAVTALHWHITGVAVVMPAVVWLFVRLARNPSARTEMWILFAGSMAVILANLFWYPSLHFDSIVAAVPGDFAAAGRPMAFVGTGGWVTGIYHLWLLVPIWFCFVNGRFMWRKGRRLLGTAAIGSAVVFLFANVLATRADFMGGRPAYMGGVPMLVSIILLLGLALGVAQREQRLALQSRGDELRAANARLEGEMARREDLEQRLAETQRMEALGQMASGVAHDFNNVLTVVNGHAELLFKRFAPGTSERQGAEAITDAAGRGASLTRQLLAFARRQELAPTEMEADRALAGMRELLASLVGRQTHLGFELGAPGRTIVADPSQFEQVVMNLAVNARDAMPEGGRLTILTSWVPAGGAATCACEGALAQGHVLLSVTDSGSGIDASTLPRIFEPFFTTKGPEEGTGLGLATVHGIVQQSGGHISVTSRTGEGTTFRICWPGAHEGAPSRPQDAGSRAVVRPA